MKPVTIGNYTWDGESPPLLIAGPCVIEDPDETVRLAEAIASLGAVKKFHFIFKASYLKANRSSASSYRGPGLEVGLEVLARVKREIGCPVISDVHEQAEVSAAAEVLDVVQIPAFLCRQTALLEAAAARARAVNVKKGQFLAPEDVKQVVAKIRGAGGENILLTERGTVFGYHDLVVDFRSFIRMRENGCPVLFDVTHSLQKPGGLGDRSDGQPEYARAMARAAAAVPCNGFFFETHFEPGRALSDSASMIPFDSLETILLDIYRIHAAVQEPASAGGRERPLS
jgi:2-dehydro-3-deoxyphosphooctonate aldolase (KDO 8-P synthase)